VLSTGGSETEEKFHGIHDLDHGTPGIKKWEDDLFSMLSKELQLRWLCLLLYRHSIEEAGTLNRYDRPFH
jgi:hypothetical protein